MNYNIYNIQQQLDSSKNVDTVPPVVKKKKHGKKDSVTQKQSDTTIKSKDAVTGNDSSVNQLVEIKNNDSVQVAIPNIVDTILAADSIAKTDTTIVKIYNTHIVSKIPENARFIFSNAPKYSAIHVDTMIKQKYTLSQVQPSIWLPGKDLVRSKTDWMIFIMILSLIVLGWVYGFFRKFFLQIFQSLYDSNVSHKLMNERSSITERVSFTLNTLFVLNIGFFVYEIFHVYQLQFFDLDSFSLFAFFLGCFIVIYIFKYMFYSFIGYVLNAPREIFEYVHNLFLFNKIYGILLIPITVCIPFLEPKFAKILIIFGVVLFAISFLFRMFRGLQISIKINFSFFYLIVYLCTVEILPILLLGKFFYKLINS